MTEILATTITAVSVIEETKIVSDNHEKNETIQVEENSKFNDEVSTTIMNLPIEIMYKILEDDQLDFSDLVSIGLSCKHMYRVVFDNDLLWSRRIQLINREKKLRKKKMSERSDSFMHVFFQCMHELFVEVMEDSDDADNNV